MKLDIPLPELGMIAGTRALAGAGIGLLLADKLGARRRQIGWTLLIMGALSTIPLAADVIGRTINNQGPNGSAKTAGERAESMAS